MGDRQVRNLRGRVAGSYHPVESHHHNHEDVSFYSGPQEKAGDTAENLQLQGMKVRLKIDLWDG